MMNIVVGIAVVVWNLVAWVVLVLAAVVTVRRPSRNFVHGRWSKGARLFAALSLGFHIDHLLIPLGAICVLAGLRKRRGDDPGIDLAPARGPKLPV